MEAGINFIGVCVVYFCHDGRGNFLMNKRSKSTRDEQGRWDPGGGEIKLGEHVLHALKREIKEEYSTDVIDYEFLGFRDVHRIKLGKKTHWVALDFKVLVDPQKVKNGEPDKHTEIKWFSLDNLPKNLHSQFHKFLKLYRNKLRLK